MIARSYLMGDSFLQDFITFRRMITPILIQIVYWIATAVVIIAGLSQLFTGSGFERMLGLLIIVLGPLAVRIYAELLMVVFRMNETLTEIKNNTQNR
jgi:hypothetical protein